MIRNVIFDFGQVLVDYIPENLIKGYNLSDEDSKILLTEVFKEIEWISLDAGTISEEEAVTSIKKRVKEELHQYVDDLIFNWWKKEFVYKPHIEELIYQLKEKGYNIYLLSNASIRQAEYFDRIPAAKCFDGRVTSADIKILKPLPSIFEYLLDKYSLKAEECLFIDDNSDNVYYALQCGFKGIIYHNDTDRLIRQLNDLNII